MLEYVELVNCVSCGAQNFAPVIDLGVQHVVDFVKDPQAPTTKAPLILQRCRKCQTVQLKHRVPPDRLYKKFWYRSGINESMRQALRDVAVCGHNAVKPSSGEKFLDIGCNDGTLLGLYPQRYTKVGIDPCTELVQEGADAGRIDVPIAGYFCKNAVAPFAPYKIITAVAMFYDLDDPLQFLKDCRDVLDTEGVLIIQMNYLKAMLDNCAFDNISHEHLTYYSLTALESLVARAGLEIQGADTNEVNGGSVRVYITHPGGTLFGFNFERQTQLHAKYHVLMSEEIDAKLHTDVPYQAFQRRVHLTCFALHDYIVRQPEGSVQIYGASTRGTVTLQCLGTDVRERIQFAAERDEHKFGLYMVGTNIKIVSEAEARKKAKQFLVLPWHFMETIKRREDQWLADGGKLIVPLPEPHVFSYDEEEVTKSLLPLEQEAE